MNPITCYQINITYWYHPDYLGSIEWVTNADGRPMEYFWYSPWGETLQTDNSWRGRFSSPFKFTGHIEDEETGLTYAGARYYPAKESQWLSVDPLYYKSPTLTPYHYVSNNPVMRIDPDGLTDFENKSTGQIVTVNDGMNQTLLISEENWQSAVDFSENQDGNNPSKDYNSFIVENSGVAVPTENEGGLIPDKEMFIQFMIFKAKNERREVAAFEVSKSGKNSEFVIQPWEFNNNIESLNDRSFVRNFGYDIGDVKSQYHTHPGPHSFGYIRGLSDQDASVSSMYNIPVHSVYSDGEIYQVKYLSPKGGMRLPPIKLPKGFTHGKKIN